MENFDTAASTKLSSCESCYQCWYHFYWVAKPLPLPMMTKMKMQGTNIASTCPKPHPQPLSPTTLGLVHTHRSIQLLHLGSFISSCLPLSPLTTKSKSSMPLKPVKTVRQHKGTSAVIEGSDSMRHPALGNDKEPTCALLANVGTDRLGLFPLIHKPWPRKWRDPFFMRSFRS